MDDHECEFIELDEDVICSRCQEHSGTEQCTICGENSGTVCCGARAVSYD